MKNFWVFGYGSLMWRPGFAFVDRHVGKIYGYHRALCIYSHVHRGTPEKPIDVANSASATNSSGFTQRLMG